MDASAELRIGCLPDDDVEAIAAVAALQGRAPTEVIPWLLKVAESARTAGRDRVLGHLLCHLAFCQAIGGETSPAEATALEALTRFELLQDAAGQAMAINVQAIVKVMLGDYASGLELLSKALPLARQAGDAKVLFGVLNSLGSALYDIDDPAAAATAYEECVAAMPADAGAYRQDGARSNLSLALARWAERDRDLGLPEGQWLPRARRAVQLAQQVHENHDPGQNQLFVATLESLSVALLVSGDADRSIELLNSDRSRQAEGASPYWAVHIAQTRARALLATGRPAEAALECERALKLAREAKSDACTDTLYRTLSLAQEACGDFAAALQSHRQFHAIRARLVFARAEHTAKALVSRLDLDRALRESRLDALTGLVNRRAFDERLEALLPTVDADHPLTLMLIDVDHFKNVNDNHGHPAGDALLQGLAEVLRRLCRGTEPPARLGGDEFAVLIEGHLAQAQVLAQRVRSALADQSAQAGFAVATISIGLAEARSTCAPRELLARADRALYDVKGRGRDGVAAAP